jgi:hypothetical protein
MPKMIWCCSARRQMAARIGRVAEECGEAERVRMKGVTRRAMEDSSELYTQMAKVIEPRLADLMSTEKRLRKQNRQKQRIVEELEETAMKMETKNAHQLKVSHNAKLANR